MSTELACHKSDMKASFHFIRTQALKMYAFIIKDSQVSIHQNNLPKDSLSLPDAQKSAMSPHIT